MSDKYKMAPSVIVAKAKELAAKKEYKKALTLLEANVITYDMDNEIISIPSSKDSYLQKRSRNINETSSI